MMIKFIFLLALVALYFNTEAQSLDVCIGVEYFPYYCYMPTYGPFQVYCTGVNASDVMEAFRWTTAQNLSYFFFQPADNFVPANLLGNTRSASIDLECSSPENQLTIDRNAFRSSSNYTTIVGLKECDPTSIDFDFLSGFTLLEEVEICNSSCIFSTHHEYYYGSVTLHINCPVSTLLTLNSFPSALINGVTHLSLEEKNLNDESASHILNSLINSNRYIMETLQVLYISNNQLTEMPKEIQNLKKLNSTFLSKNWVPMVIKNGSLAFSVPVEKLDLSSSQIYHIESGAFSGDFRNAYINLNYNNLSRLESGVFEQILSEMIGYSGAIYFSGNPIDCVSDPSHLAWLLCDNRNLMEPLIYAACSNGMSLLDVDTKIFKSFCPGTQQFEPMNKRSPLVSIIVPSVSAILLIVVIITCYFIRRKINISKTVERNQQQREPGDLPRYPEVFLGLQTIDHQPSNIPSPHISSPNNYSVEEDLPSYDEAVASPYF